jgi:hypothetical protein
MIGQPCPGRLHLSVWMQARSKIVQPFFVEGLVSSQRDGLDVEGTERRDVDPSGSLHVTSQGVALEQAKIY